MITEVVTNLVLCLVISTKEAPTNYSPFANLWERYVELKSTNNEKPLPDGRMPNEATSGFAFSREYVKSIYLTMCGFGGYDESRWPDAIPINYAEHHLDREVTASEWSVGEKPIGYLHKEAFLKACDRLNVHRSARPPKPSVPVIHPNVRQSEEQPTEQPKGQPKELPKGWITKEAFDAITPAEWEMVIRLTNGGRYGDERKASK